jgi:Ca2+-binding RTX toxin-like protein
MRYQWESSFDGMTWHTVGNNETYVIREQDQGAQLRGQVGYFDLAGHYGTASTLATSQVIAPMQAPPPTLQANNTLISSVYALPDGTADATLVNTEYTGAVGNAQDNLIEANYFGDHLDGGDGNDQLQGNVGADVLIGGAGNDWVDGGTGDDLFIGGSGPGNDTYIGGDGIDTVKYTSAINPVLVDLAMGTAFGVDIDHDILLNIENIIGGQAGDSLIGDAGNNVIEGYTGNDTIDGGDGIDTARYSGNYADYTVYRTDAGLTVIDKSASDGNDGTDTLRNTEFLAFADQSINTSSGIPSAHSLDMLAYSWKGHTLLSGVAFTSTDHTGITDTDGTANVADVIGASISLAASRAIPSAEASATASAVNLQDAIAILKMIVGLDVNGAGKPLSPYQSLAADFDGNGQVQLTDAIGVLKHVVGLSAPDPTWHFVSELDPSIPGKTNLNPGAAATSISVDISGGSSVHAGLVGYLSGDVDGSFAGASGSSSLSGSYFTTLLAANPEFNSSQFGIYA